MMLAQVLAKRGLHARVVGAGAVARGAIDGLDVSGVDMVVVSYLEATGSMSGLRYLMRRIHARAPGLHTVVGLWQVDPALLNEDRLRTTIGADHYTTSLRDAVATCVSRMPHLPVTDPQSLIGPPPALDVSGAAGLAPA